MTQNMTRTRAILLLLANLLKELALSGWSTARVILTPRGQVQPGFARLDYGDLSGRLPRACSVCW